MNSRKDQPPRLANRFLRWFCPPALHEGIAGDLDEAFEADVQRHGHAVARRKYYWNTLRFFRPSIILRNKISYSLINTIMIGNYFKTASRNIMKRKLYSFINAFGLSVAIAFCTLIYLYVQDEKNFDDFHEHKELIYRIEEKSFDTWQHDQPDPYRKSAWIQTALAPTLKEELPEVELATRYNPDHDGIFRYADKVFTEKLTYVDADFFTMFSFPLVKGSTSKLFQNNTDAVVTTDVAKKYFGDEDPIGKTVSIDCGGEKSFTIAGVIAPNPTNSSLHYNVILSQVHRPWYERNMTNWGNFNTPTFVKLRIGSDLTAFKSNLDKIVDKYMKEKLDKWRKEATVPIPDDVKMLEYEFTALPDIHLKKEVGWEKVSDPQYSFILGGIALLILLIACINYISLSLTTSAARRSEVGVRKSVGAQRNQLIYQFGIESMVLAFCSMLIGISLVFLFLPAFNQFTAKGIEITWQNGPQILGVATLITVVIGLLAGCYPSLFLSRFNPAVVLKGKFTSRLQAGFTKPLVVLQFFFSACLTICSIVMYQQMQFVTTKDLGYSQDQIIVIPTQTGWTAEADKVVERFRARGQQEPSIVSVSGTTSSFNQGFSRYGYKINGEQKSAYVYGADPFYIPLLDIKLVQGRNFDPAISSDTLGVIVNEALVRDMKWTDPMNEHLNWNEDTVGLGAKVIGVMKDYHFRSLESEVEPLFISMNKQNVGYLTTMLVKVSSTDLTSSLDKVRAMWHELNPGKPFDYTFLDEDVARQYETHKRWMGITGLATGFAIIISCLGLFGLSGINSVNRTKEIGIRKVMGANLTTIFVLLNRQYVWPSLIAFGLGIPFSWYAMNKWLADFKFKIALSWEIFAVSVLAGLLLALLTVSYHAVKASLTNPAETLKYE
jgi:putative ABC transport system permease protein